MRKAIENNAKILAIFAIACTALVALVDFLTKDKIAEQQLRHLNNTLAELIDDTLHTNKMADACIVIQDETLGSRPQKAYLAFNDTTPVAAAMTVMAPDGYNGNIELLVAINVQDKITGVRTLKHQETPGLGDKVELRKSNWILSFNDKSITTNDDPQWAVKKDGGMFDQFTGATITPRAVVNATKRAALYFKEHKASMFASQKTCQER